MAEAAKVDPMHQFTIEPMFGTDHWQIAGYNIAFTNSSLWMAIAAVALLIFVAGPAALSIMGTLGAVASGTAQ